MTSAQHRKANKRERVSSRRPLQNQLGVGWKRWSLAVCFVASASAFCVTCSENNSVDLEKGSYADSAHTLRGAIREAAAYLTEVSESNGRFVYLYDTNGPVVTSRYNILRHSGALYALAGYYRHSGDPEARRALLRGARYLLQQHIKELDGQPESVAVWSLPDEEVSSTRPVAKLGGTALGLIALIEAQRLEAGIVSMDTLEALGRFILSMQRPSGGFYSKYDDVTGVDRDFVSLYYPGEAILALTMLFEHTKAQEWLEAASRGASFLIEQRRHLPLQRLPADHWLMIASARLQLHVSSADGGLLTREALLKHNRELARAMLTEQVRDADASSFGAFTSDGRSTPTATRLEGLLALSGWLDEEDPLGAEIVDAARAGVAFLRRCQVPGGPAKGGVKRALRRLDSEGSAFNRRQAEIRIDYVQHALSAWLAYSALEGDEQTQGGLK